MKSTKLRTGFAVAGRKTRIFLGLLLVVVVTAALFDWNWLRGPLVNYLAEKSGREVRIEDLHVTIGAALRPKVRLRGVYVENAVWAAKRPFVVAGEIVFTFSIDSLWERRPIISRLTLTDADMDMERRADGLRNWRLTDPENRGPGRVRVMTLQAVRSKIRFFNGEADLDITSQATPAEPAVDGPPGTDSLSNKLVIEGKYRGVRFEAAGLAGSTISFRDSDYAFPLRGHLTAGKTRVDVDGTFTDLFDMGPMDAKVHVAGPTLSLMHPFLKFRPPVSRPYMLEAQLKQLDRKYTFAQLRGKVGDTDFAGDATYDRNPERPLAKVSLRSESADLADIVILSGMDYRVAAPGNKPAREEPAEADKTESTAAEPSDRLFSNRPVSAERLRAADAYLKLELKKLRAASFPMLESLHLAADLVDGALQVAALDVGVAGGHVTGTLAFDGKNARASLDARNLQLEKLLPALPSTAPSSGAIRSRLRLTGQGNSFAAVLANSNGTFAAIVDNGQISNLLDAKLGLNVGKVVGLKIRGDRDIALHCGAAAFNFSNGVGKSQLVLLETEQTHTDGVATIDLREQNFDLLLTPQPKKPGLFTRHSSISVQGSFRKAGYKIEERVPLERGGVAVAPAVIATLFRPLLDAGEANGRCAAVLGVRATAAKAVAAKE